MKNPILSLLIIAITLATLYLFWPVVEWFVLKMSLANGWLHIMAFSGLCGLGVYRFYHAPKLPLHAPRFALWPTLIWVCTGLAFLLNESQVGFNTLSAALFILFVYGLSGHCLRRSLWLSLFVPTSLLILVLPFEHYLDIYLGFPLRLLSADWASSVLQHTGLPLVTTESVLMIDNRAAIVDLDCSGIKSLWIGLIFYLLLTWIEHYRIGWRWLIIGLLYVFLLIIANVARITILVLLELVLKQPEVAGILHQTLGLLGFAIASTTIWWVLQKWALSDNKSAIHFVKQADNDLELSLKNIGKTNIGSEEYFDLNQEKSDIRLEEGFDSSQKQKQKQKQKDIGSEGNFDSSQEQVDSELEGKFDSNQETANKGILHSNILSSITLAAIVSMILLYQPQSIIAQTSAVQPLNLPTKYALKTSALNPQEQVFFTSNQAQANKYHLTLSLEGKSVRVAMVLVWSRAWKTHHVPENCYLSQGFSIDAQGVWQLPQHTLRYLQLNRPNSNATLGRSQTAAYWFQSASDSTPDYSSRVIDNLFHPGRNWVMASILFDQPVTPEQITPFIKTLKQAIGDQFYDIQ